MRAAISVFLLVVLVPFVTANAPASVADPEGDVTVISVLRAPTLGQELRGQPADSVYAEACSAPQLDLLAANAVDLGSAVRFEATVADLDAAVTCGGPGVPAWTDAGAEDNYRIVAVCTCADRTFAAYLLIDPVTAQLHPIGLYSAQDVFATIAPTSFSRAGDTFAITLPKSGLGFDFRGDPVAYAVPAGDYTMAAASFYETEGPAASAVTSHRLSFGDSTSLEAITLS